MGRGAVEALIEEFSECMNDSVTRAMRAKDDLHVGDGVKTNRGLKTNRESLAVILKSRFRFS